MSIPNPSGYQVFPSYVGSDGGKQPLILLPPAYNAMAASTPITLGLIWTGGQTAPPNVDNADFKLLVQPGATPLVNIVLTGTNMWGGLPAARTALRTNFVQFLQDVSTKLEGAQLLLPGSTDLIARQIAALLPVLPSESLFYNHGLWSGLASSPQPYVDIRPGMRLRLDMEASQFVSPASPMNGYVVSGSNWLQVSSVAANDGSRLLAFDPFLAAIRSPAITAPASGPIVAASALDLQPAGGARPYWRLFFPAQMGAPTQPGDATIANNVTLVGASSLAALNAATAQFPTPDTTTPGTIYAVFLGRAAVTPEIPVWVSVSGLATTSVSMQWVALGTTLGGMVEQFAMPTIDPVRVQTPWLMRNMPLPSATPAPQQPISFFTSGLTLVPRAMWDVPLIAGDTVTIRLQP